MQPACHAHCGFTLPAQDPSDVPVTLPPAPFRMHRFHVDFAPRVLARFVQGCKPRAKRLAWTLPVQVPCQRECDSFASGAAAVPYAIPVPMRMRIAMRIILIPLPCKARAIENDSHSSGKIHANRGRVDSSLPGVVSCGRPHLTHYTINHTGLLVDCLHDKSHKFLVDCTQQVYRCPFMHTATMRIAVLINTLHDKSHKFLVKCRSKQDVRCTGPVT